MDCVFVVVAGFGVSEERTHTKRGFFWEYSVFRDCRRCAADSPLSKLAFCDVASRSYRAPPLPRVRT
jgi:hypothetical protein